MSKKTLNATNLERLGADRLAALVMDLVQGSAALQRRARMELSAAQGPHEMAADIRKRFASLRRATGFVDWRAQKALVRDLEGLLAMIDTQVVAHDPAEAFELLWSFLHLAPALHARTDDSNGAVGQVMSGGRPWPSASSRPWWRRITVSSTGSSRRWPTRLGTRGWSI